MSVTKRRRSHLRRALQRELGVSPIELAQTQRLLLAKQLLTETRLPMSSIADASGFQSLRRFNALFRERYRLSPEAIRRNTRGGPASRKADNAGRAETLRLALSYRPPIDWGGLMGFLAARALPVLMPLCARIRHLFDLDAEPAAIETHLRTTHFHGLHRRHHGLRVPGAFDGFDLGPPRDPRPAGHGERRDHAERTTDTSLRRTNRDGRRRAQRPRGLRPGLGTAVR